MVSERMRYRLEGRVAFLTLGAARPRNRIGAGLAGEMEAACARAADDGARAVVLGSEGRFFATGEDGPASVIWGLDIPVVAAIGGDALDGGLEAALACDVRIAAQGARFGVTQVSRGGLPRDGGTQRLARLIGHARALDLLLTARVLDADEALAMGLVHRIVEGGELAGAAAEAAGSIARGGPTAARYAKEAARAANDGMLDGGLRLEADLSIILQSTRDRREGIRAFMERRKPVFTGE